MMLLINTKEVFFAEYPNAKEGSSQVEQTWMAEIRFNVLNNAREKGHFLTFQRV